MRRILPRFEHRAQPMISSRQFARRMAHSGVLVLIIVVLSLWLGMVGYHFLERLTWIDAFLNASMLMGGMGPVDVPRTWAGKFFAGMYALYCGLAVIFMAGLILAPIAHRILHRFHLELDAE